MSATLRTGTLWRCNFNRHRGIERESIFLPESLQVDDRKNNICLPISSTRRISEIPCFRIYRVMTAPVLKRFLENPKPFVWKGRFSREGMIVRGLFGWQTSLWWGRRRSDEMLNIGLLRCLLCADVYVVVLPRNYFCNIPNSSSNGKTRNLSGTRSLRGRGKLIRRCCATKN